MSDQIVCNGDLCPVCTAEVIPGLDYCYCRSCKGYYPTQTGLAMETAKDKPKPSLSRKAGRDHIPLIDFDINPSGGYSHHDFENDYR